MNLPVKAVAAAVAMLVAAAADAGPVISNTVDAATLANTIAGAGVTVSNATLTYAGATTLASPTGTFTGGTASVGFDAGIVLTNGSTACATGTNTTSSCGSRRGGVQADGNFDRTTLAFDFTSTTGQVFFQYVFASEEYNEYVGGNFNDQFELLLNSTNIARLPGGGVVSINNVNCGSNAAFYRNNTSMSGGSGPACGAANPNLNLEIQYDGLTAVLTASGTVAAGTNSFAFTIFDRGDAVLDSGVFIRAGSFAGGAPAVGVPEPGSLALACLGLFAAFAVRRSC